MYCKFTRIECNKLGQQLVTKLGWAICGIQGYPAKESNGTCAIVERKQIILSHLSPKVPEG